MYVQFNISLVQSHYLVKLIIQRQLLLFAKKKYYFTIKYGIYTFHVQQT